MRRAAGFTLVEMLIALVLLALMFAVLLPALQIAGRSWGAAEERIEAASAGAQASQILRRMLETARPLPWSTASERTGLGFLGGPEQLVFITSLPAYRGGGGLQVVRLGIGSADGEAGLILTWWPYHPKVALEADVSQQHPELVLSGADRVRLRYYGRAEPNEDPQWFGEWSADELPRMVSLQVFRGDDLATSLIAAPRLSPPDVAGLQGPRS